MVCLAEAARVQITVRSRQTAEQSFWGIRFWQVFRRYLETAALFWWMEVRWKQRNVISVILQEKIIITKNIVDREISPRAEVLSILLRQRLKWRSVICFITARLIWQERLDSIGLAAVRFLQIAERWHWMKIISSLIHLRIMVEQSIWMRCRRQNWQATGFGIHMLITIGLQRWQPEAAMAVRFTAVYRKQLHWRTMSLQKMAAWEMAPGCGYLERLIVFWHWKEIPLLRMKRVSVAAVWSWIWIRTARWI